MRFPAEPPKSALHSLLKHSTFNITFLLAEAVAVRTRILGRTGGLLCQPCFRLRVKRTEETGGGESQIKHCTRGTAQHNRGIKRRRSIPHSGSLCWELIVWAVRRTIVRFATRSPSTAARFPMPPTMASSASRLFASAEILREERNGRIYVFLAESIPGTNVKQFLQRKAV